MALGSGKAICDRLPICRTFKQREESVIKVEFARVRTDTTTNIYIHSTFVSRPGFEPEVEVGAEQYDNGTTPDQADALH